MQDTEVKGFNQGYLLAEYEPALLDKLISGLDNNNEYRQALMDGKKQYEKDKFLSSMKQTKSKKERDKDHEQ